jgi:hypothetical protein
MQDGGDPLEGGTEQGGGVVGGERSTLHRGTDWQVAGAILLLLSHINTAPVILLMQKILPHKN